MKIFMGNRVLAAGGGEEQEPFDVVLETAGVVQVAMALRATHAAPLDRGNRTTVLKFSVHRRHPSPAAATEFLLLHGAGLTALEGPVTLVSEGAGGGTFHLHSAVLKRIQGSQEGTATVHGYEIIGGGLTDHLPEGN